MHILIIPSWYPRDGVDVDGSFFREQAIALSRLGCKVGVIAFQLRLLEQLHQSVFDVGGTRSTVDQGVYTYRKNGVKWFPGLPRAHAMYCRYHGLNIFDRYVSDHGLPDLVHVHSMLNAGVVAAAIRDKHALPYVVTEHSSVFGRGMSISQLNIFRRIAQGAERRFAVSSQFAKSLHAALGERVGTWDVIANMVGENFFSHPISEEVTSRFSFVSISFLNKNKRIDLLIRSFAKAFRGNHAVRLNIGGGGSERSFLVNLSRQLGVSEQVSFLGALTREQVLECISRSNALVLSSSFETFGVALIEALAMGKPVVATRCGGPEDIVRAEDGILVRTDDLGAMAAAMLSIYQNQSSYDPETIRQGCKERFGEEVVIDRLLTVYRNLAPSHIRGQLIDL